MDHTRDQCSPCLPEVYELQSVCTAAELSPMRLIRSVSLKRRSSSGFRPFLVQSAIGNTKPDLGRSNKDGSSLLNPARRRASF